MSVRPIIRFAMLLYVSTACLAPGAHAADSVPIAPATGFDFATLERTAQSLAQAAFVPDRGAPGEDLEHIHTYMQYRSMSHDIKRSLWRREGLSFQLQLFHRGFLYHDRVFINVLEEGKAQRVPFSTDLFDYGENRVPKGLSPDTGFAGFRLLYPVLQDGVYEEFVAFLGASYFRAQGLGEPHEVVRRFREEGMHQYGLSARGLALDSGLAKAEEFPVFREFWIEKPRRDSTSLTVFALLDGPSATGAYQFVIHPGIEVTMDVKCRLFMRQGVERLGIAPLTSMFAYGENSDRFQDGFRPELHDSDGLLIHARNGEKVWRPLINPPRTALSVFKADDVAGFGLMQRDRDYDHYQDRWALYHLRPSAWVEPVGAWGPGSIYLIELATEDEWHDNIVAFWIPERRAQAGQHWTFAYRLHFLLDHALDRGSGLTASTRSGRSETGEPLDVKRKFMVEFDGDKLRALDAHAPVEADVSSSAGRIDRVRIVKDPFTATWRLVFAFEPGDVQTPIDLRAYLKSGNEALTETWIYQWRMP
ncbi:MAG: glucan biosynthesis protein [Pseudomonadota bacterium]|nr:glucan biosynthesis protein [Pseudomonadota bacterium]